MNPNRSLLLVLATATALLFAGCSGTARISMAPGGIVVIQISPDPGSRPLLPGSGGAVAGRPPVNSDEPEPPSQLAPPAAPTSPPSTTLPPAAPADPDTRTALASLRDTYGIEVFGNPSEASIRQVYTAATQLYPQDTRGVRMNFTDRSAGGVMGSWSGGNIIIYRPARESLTTIFHEIMHHVTLLRRSNVGYGVAREVVNALGSSNPRTYPPSVITRSYARTQLPEFWAELFSVYRIQTRRLGNRDLFAISPSFNPPASLRPILEKMYPSL